MFTNWAPWVVDVTIFGIIVLSECCTLGIICLAIGDYVWG